MNGRDLVNSVRRYRGLESRIDDLQTVEECEGFLEGIKFQGRELTESQRQRLANRKIDLQKKAAGAAR